MVEADALGKLPDDYREVLVLLIPALRMETGTGTGTQLDLDSSRVLVSPPRSWAGRHDRPPQRVLKRRILANPNRSCQVGPAHGDSSSYAFRIRPDAVNRGTEPRRGREPRNQRGTGTALRDRWEPSRIEDSPGGSPPPGATRLGTPEPLLFRRQSIDKAPSLVVVPTDSPPG